MTDHVCVCSLGSPDPACDVCGHLVTSHPDSVPVPVPERVLLPAPDGRDEHGHFWLLSSGEWYARPGQIDLGWGYLVPPPLHVLERDALAMLAAVRWARGSRV